MKIGKYIVTPRSMKSDLSGGYVGTANLLWDEADTTCDLSIHFHKSFETAEEAEQHAVQQIELRVKDGKL